MRVLGDILESISGAILVDTRVKLDVVWKKLKPILSPIVTPENMESQPLWGLHELRSYHNYELAFTTTKTRNVHVAHKVCEADTVSLYKNTKTMVAEHHGYIHDDDVNLEFKNYSTLFY